MATALWFSHHKQQLGKTHIRFNCIGVWCCSAIPLMMAMDISFWAITHPMFKKPIPFWNDFLALEYNGLVMAQKQNGIFCWITLFGKNAPWNCSGSSIPTPSGDRNRTVSHPASAGERHRLTLMEMFPGSFRSLGGPHCSVTWFLRMVGVITCWTYNWDNTRLSW